MVAAALAVIVGSLVGAGCRSAAPAGEGAPAPRPDAQPTPQMAATPEPAPAPRAETGRPRRAADVEFVHGMMAHHAQALAMTAMVPSRSRRDDLRALGQRIEVSQRDEIALMQRWLTARGERVPSVDPAHAHHMDPRQMPMAMPGMLTAAELQRLADAQGAAFDRLFLQSMIRHHEGALTMVAEYLAKPGAGQDTELFRFASDVDADQRAEIRRMRALLDAMARP
ncbi:hypothetical protein rosag_33620 [Roseisolibacter agri]|uniref:DUF305 domain-containing protein n=2 Tax=Roseisolibacter agri TaxID=2014610 RepID=A0AA37VFG9_9BACT|nr:hypothetical protein rosag_33620 [Roseisolibacter agri]